MNRRNEKEMIDLILQIAKSSPRILAVVMNGSRASPSATKDIFQDYDIVYIVTEVEDFVHNEDWIKPFGDILIMQKPDEMEGNWDKDKTAFGYLMLFKDSNRIDLTLFHQSRVPTWHRDSQSVLLLDKENILGKYEEPSDKDYLPTPPTAKEFADCCNEFLWVSTYVAKGIWRKQLTYAKNCSEHTVKEQLLKLLTWYAAIKTDFEKTIGFYGKYIEKYIEPDLWNDFKKTYVDSKWENMWAALFLMCEIFNKVAKKISQYYGYPYQEDEYERVLAYLKTIEKSDTESC